MKTFSILITTKNRIEALKITLQKIHHLIDRPDVECIICNDGSTDETSKYIKEFYPNIQLIEHTISKGLIASRNKLLNLTKANYAISLDDDAHIVSDEPLKIIESFFQNNPKCGVLACRIFWGLILPNDWCINENETKVRSFVGCGHVWNMKAWHEIPNYPAWFVFYGEEDFAAFQLFKNGWEVHYVPEILVHHRVNVKARKKDKDYQLRLRRSLRSGWYLYLLFYPLQLIPKKLVYSLLMQIKLKVFKGDFKALLAIIQALFDVIWNIPKLYKNANRLTMIEFEQFMKLNETKLYWEPNENEN
ncbi:glycosyltransferase family 2 protein [Lutibacter maritimus]|uniref:Glycosyltransferase, GT2 family n=1 Tax=Lutibacter maritimus TaxID=593133 RepID=A0A1I6SNH6_9FLAO|nr:glycosyltransferase family 2 protein [Lutibacter maritimus]SFS78513.1 Glycosyltransferase, GT2 family [Lutibacter maritimus]